MSTSVLGPVSISDGSFNIFIYRRIQPKVLVTRVLQGEKLGQRLQVTYIKEWKEINFEIMWNVVYIMSFLAESKSKTATGGD